MARTITHEFKEWHTWSATKGYLVSNENTKKLLRFDELDDVINYLWIEGAKDAARSLNKLIKS